jgi:hypothetical protein
MNEQRKDILDMLAEGKITAAEAEQLIAALERDQPPPAASLDARPKGKAKYLRPLQPAGRPHRPQRTSPVVAGAAYARRRDRPMSDRDDVESSAGAALDTSVPHSARVWNYWLGGKDNFAADRRVGDEFAQLYPNITVVARTSRAFLKRAVTFLAGEAGLRQFLDIGTGMPTVENTHQVAQAVAPESRIVYVDNDPMVLVHARALLTGSPAGATEYIDADLHDPAAILDAAGGSILDLSEPVGLILMNILGHVRDLDEAVAIVHHLMDALPRGSYLVTADGTNVIDGPAFEEAIAVWNANAPLSYHLRHPDQLARYLTGLEVLAPGLVPCARWRPAGDAGPDDLREVDEYGAVARKP